MAKTATATASETDPRLLLGYRLAKLLAIVLGLPATLISLMACAGGLTGNGYVRVLGAVAVGLAVPLFVADRLLPDDPKKARGLVSDVCAVFWLAIPFALAAAANGVTRPLFVQEGDRLAADGYADLARATYALAGVTVTSVAAPSPSGSSSAVAMAEASASPSGSASASPAGSAAVPATSASAGATSAADAGAPHGKADKTPAELFKELAPSVVTIFVKGSTGEASGTGFLIQADGTLVTNHHVIADARAIRIKFEGGAIFESVDVLADDAAADLALLRIDLTAPVDGGLAVQPAPLVLGDSEGVVVGERAVAIGNPLGLEHTLTDGIVSSRRIYEGRAWIQMSVPISPGNSGGPLFNLRGEVIGITTASIMGYGIAQNLNLAVPVNDLKKLIRPAYPARHKIGDGSAPSRW